MAPDPSPIRVVLADDHLLFREGVRHLLEAEPGFIVVGEAGDAEQAVKETVLRQPDVLLLDVSMPRLSGLDVLATISRECPTVRTILLTAQIGSRQIVDALEDGARGVVLKDMASQLLYKCIRDVMSGRYWVGHGAVRDLVQALRDLRSAGVAGPPMTRLTARERQILAAITDGATNEDIARQLGLHTQTVKNHLTHLFDKLGVSNRLELALFAINHRMVDRTEMGNGGNDADD
jgi:two-component system, NarL family, nitrate/nitrite response regulator NarL